MANDLYLQHYGVKGMKWGIRRYQNKDGTLTDAGERRYDRDIRENKAKKKDNRIQIDGPDPSRWVKEDLKRSKDVVDSFSSMNKEVKNIERQTRSKSRKKVDLSSMSDKQLRDTINRANLERQYSDLVTQNNTSKGRAVVQDILEYGGSALAITGSALAIALSIKELRG